MYYYMQNKTKFTGNCVMWWRKEGNGYTSNITDAQVWNKEQAIKQMQTRPDTDVAWEKDYVDGCIQSTVDHQYLKNSRQLKIT